MGWRRMNAFNAKNLLTASLISLMLANAIAVASEKLRAEESLPAFPGAVGQGAKATGGRGGDVYHVTNLKDYDNFSGEQKIPGSLRHAIRAEMGPRTIVFDVGGTIELVAPLEILKDNITIAGQTAPGPGITLWGYPVKISTGSDIIVRHLRIRLGDFNVRTAKKGGDDSSVRAAIGNGISVQGDANRVIVDHLSVSWGIDETFSVTNSRNVTVQNCLIAESLNDSYHPKGPHGYGSLIRGMVTPQDQERGEGGFTFFGNLWAHHRARSPSVGGEQSLGDGRSEMERRRTDLNLINNVVYNWRDQATHRSNTGDVRINMIGNTYICGPERSIQRIFKEDVEGKTAIYQRDNYIDDDQDNAHNGIIITTELQIAEGFQDFDSDDLLLSSNDGEPFSFLNFVDRILPCEEAYAQVLGQVGAFLRRDAIDQRTINSVTKRSGQLIDSQEEFREEGGQLPGIDDLTAVHRREDFDTDQDGMPNEFEVRYGLDPNDPEDRNGTNLSNAGYTNLEVYLNSLMKKSSEGIALRKGTSSE